MAVVGISFALFDAVRLFTCLLPLWRIVRSVRMGKDGIHPGTAYTLVTPKQASFAGDLAYHLEVRRK